MGFLKKHPALFLGAVLTVLFLGLRLMRIEFFDSLELKLYDMRMKLRTEPVKKGSDDIVIIDIDDDSVEKLGRWPWPRSILAKGIDKITAANPRIIGLNVFLTEAEQATSLKELKYLAQLASQTNGTKSEIYQAISEAVRRLDNDRLLKESIEQSKRVVLPIYLKNLKGLTGDKIGTYKDRIEIPPKNVKKAKDAKLLQANEIIKPMDDFLASCIGTGHVNLEYDSDGKIRRESLIYLYEGHYIPCFSLRLAALYLNMPEIQAVAGSSVNIGAGRVMTTRRAELLINFKGPSNSFKRYSFFEVIEDKIPSIKELLKNKIVIITPSAAGVQNPVSTPTDRAMTVGEFTANAVWSMLNGKFITKPSWDTVAGFAMLCIIGAVITFVLPRIRAFMGFAVFIGIAACMLGFSTFLFVSKGLWIQIIYPLLLLILGYIGAVSLNFFFTESRKEKVEVESAETNRMLGVSFQSQGMLDMAFDKFRKVPVDEQMKDVLYNLALDYERKRQFNKAASVYEHIEKYDPKYKDVANKRKKLLQASETMVFGEGFLSGNPSDPLLSGGTETRPTLGRYEIMRQLGKGAMGIVYLGQDPRINRTTAIKTFRFTEDLDPEEAKKLKEKFFREAESAGTLSHPNIVTIYDAGDEHDLAYIAMEFLEGEDLQKYTKRNNLLPMRKVIDYVADIADALDYAHQKGIVHRDIKPANIMLLKSGIVKITDFGIARITATSQTQTGVVKGTPHYMSPEQISGEKVDGRSDIFSLGAMLYQLLTGIVPFKGDSPAALMHQIMNVPHPDPRKINPKIVKPLAAIIDKAMEKSREKRYQRANHMAAHLKALGKKLDAHMMQKKKTAEE